MRRVNTLSIFALGLLFFSASLPVIGQTDAAAVMLNKRPIVDLGDDVRKAIAGGVDLNAAFLVELTGQIGTDGKIEGKTSRFTRTEGDKQLVELTKKAIESINDAGYFQYLSSSQIKNLKVIVAEDAQNARWELSSDLENEGRAKARRTSFDLLIKLATSQKKDRAITDDEKDDLTLLESISVSSEGSKLIIRSVLPKAVVQDMIKRRVPTK